MHELVGEARVVDPEAAGSGSMSSRGALIICAWIAILLLSKLPLVIAEVAFGTDLPWITPAWITAAFLLTLITVVWPMLRPLRSFFVVMGLVILLNFVVYPWLIQTPIFIQFFERPNPLIPLFGSRILLAGAAVIVLAALLGMGYRRKQLYLTVGELNATVGGAKSPGSQKPLRWLLFGTIITLLLAGLFFWFLTTQMQLSLSGFGAALPWLPLVLICAVLNAFGEEAMYRAALLAPLLPNVGAGHAIWMTSIWFGLGHYYGGIPSGPIGFVQSGLVALLLGKAMLDTRGLGWPMIIHVALDTVIYTGLILGFVA